MRGQIILHRTRSGEPGFWWYRLRVPARLRAQLGWEVRRSLRTTDLEEAKRRAVEVARWVDHQLAAAMSQAHVEADPTDRIEERLTPAWVKWDYSLRHDGVLLGPEPQQWRPGLAPAPSAGLDGSHVVAAGPTLSQLVEAWAVEQAPPRKTVASWTRTVERFVEHLGHCEAERVTRKDVIAWKDHLLSQGLSPVTARDMVGTLKTVYNAAIHNERLARQDNPAQGVKVARRREPGTGRRGYTPEEAALCLRAALALRTGARSDQDVAWTVLLLATSGARLGEIAGARVGDIRHDAAGGWFLAIEASEERGLKTDAAARNVPLPRQVIEEWGFLAWLKGRAPGDRLFPSITPDLHGSLAGTMTKRLTRFVRPLVPDLRVAPAHSWRHLWVTRLRAASVPREIAEVLLGHSRGSVHDRYGQAAPLSVLRQAVDQVEPFVV